MDHGFVVWSFIMVDLTFFFHHRVATQCIQ